MTRGLVRPARGRRRRQWSECRTARACSRHRQLRRRLGSKLVLQAPRVAMELCCHENGGDRMKTSYGATSGERCFETHSQRAAYSRDRLDGYKRTGQGPGPETGKQRRRKFAVVLHACDWRHAIQGNLHMRLNVAILQHVVTFLVAPRATQQILPKSKVVPRLARCRRFFLERYGDECFQSSTSCQQRS